MTNILKKIAHPLNVKAIDTYLEQKIQSFSFPLDHLSTKIKTLLNVEDLEFKRINATYREKNTLLEGLSKELLTLCYTDIKTSSNCFLLISFNAAQKLMQIFENKQEGQVMLENEALVNDYCKYLSTLFLQEIKSLDLIEDLFLELGQSPLPKNDSYCVDIMVKSHEKSLELRLVFETEFLKQMEKNLKRRQSLLDIADNLAEVNLALSPTLDTVTLTKNEIEQLNVGDVIVINTQFIPKDNKGTFILNLEQLPIAFARFNEGKIKILEAIKNNQESAKHG